MNFKSSMGQILLDSREKAQKAGFPRGNSLLHDEIGHIRVGMAFCTVKLGISAWELSFARRNWPFPSGNRLLHGEISDICVDAAFCMAKLGISVWMRLSARRNQAFSSGGGFLHSVLAS
jgi:hypothetical protein